MITKLGFFTDLHARNDTPEKRTDNFRETILNKLQQIGEIFKDVDLVLFGGDLGHTPDPSYSLMNTILRELKSWNKPIIGVVGSHDYFGYQKKTLERTMVGTMVAAGVIQLVDVLEQPYCVFNRNHKIVITGTTHSYDIVNYPEKLNHEYILSDADLQIQLVHCDLSHKPVPWPHILIQDINTKSQLVLSGHIHSGWEEPIKINNTTFYNPGSIARLEKSKIIRVPRVSIIEIYERGGFQIKNVLLEAEPDPFKNVSQEEFEENTSQDVSKLLNFIENTQMDVVNVKELLMNFAKQEGCADEVIEKIFILLESVKN